MASDATKRDELELLANELTAASTRLLQVGLDAITAELAPPLPTSVAEYLAIPPPKQIRPSSKSAARVKPKPKAKKKQKTVVRLQPPPMPPAGTPENTAARMLICLRTIQQRSQRTRWQDLLLGLVHQFHAEAQETTSTEQPAEVERPDRPRTPDVLSAAMARSVFWQPMHSDCWRKCEPPSPAMRSPSQGSLLTGSGSPAAGSDPAGPGWAKVRSKLGKTSSKKGSLAPVKGEVRMRRPALGAGFRVLSSFRSDAGMSKTMRSSVSDSKLLTLNGAVDIMKEGGLWPENALPRSSPELPPLKGSVSPSMKEQSTELLPAEASLTELTQTTHAVQSTSEAWFDSAEFPVEELAVDSMSEGPGSPSTLLPSPHRKSVVELFPGLARRKEMPSRRITFGTEDGEVSTDKPPVDVRLIPSENKDSTPGNSARGAAHRDFETTKTMAMEDLAALAADDEEPEPSRGGFRHPPQWTRKQAMFEKVQSLGAGAKGYGSMGPSRYPKLQIDAANIDATPQFAFLAACTQERAPPRVPRAVIKAVVDSVEKKGGGSAGSESPAARRAKGEGSKSSSSFLDVVSEAVAASKDQLSLDLASYGVGDSGLRALGESMDHLGLVKALNLEGNKLSCTAVSEFLKSRMPASGGTLKELNLSRNKTLGEGTWTTLTQMLLDDKLRVLETLRLSEVMIPVPSWEPLMKALLNAGSLRLLDVSDTRLGLGQQAPIAAVAQLAADGVLTDLDISGNFVQSEGAEALVQALGQTLHLTKLDLSHNAGDYITGLKTQKSPRAARAERAERAAAAAAAGDADAEAEGPAGDDEAAAEREVLAALYSDPPPFSPLLLIIEGLLYNNTLQSLSLVHNSLEYAADFMLAEVLSRHPCLEHLNVSSNPHGIDGLGCLLRGVGLSPARSSFKMEVTDLRDCAVSAAACKYNFGDPSRLYVLHLPHPQHRCVLRTLLDRPKIGGKESKACFQDVEYVLGSLLAGMWSFSSIQRDDKGYWKIPTVGALRCTYNAAAPSTPRGESGPLAKVQDWHRRGRVPLGLEGSISLAAAYGTCRTDIQRVLFLESMADSLLLKTAHLRLFVWHSPATLGVEVVRLLFPAIGDLAETLPMDILRNRHENARVRADIRNLRMLNLRNPTGRHTLQLSNPCDRAYAVRLQAVSAFEQQLQKAEGRPDVSQYGNYEPVRNMQHNGHGVLHGEQIRQFADYVVPSGGLLVLDYASRARALRRGTQVVQAKTSDKILAEVQNVLAHSRATWAETLQAFRASVADRLSLAIEDVRNFIQLFVGLAQDRGKLVPLQGRRLSKAMSKAAPVEALLACFGRCLEPTALASKALLYDPRLYTPDQAAEVRVRLGSVNVLDWAHCGEESTNLPSGNRYSLDLTLHEDQQVAKYLVNVAKRETKDPETFQSLSECSVNDEKMVGTEWQASWMANPPNTGTFSCLFSDEEGVEADPFAIWSARREFAERVLGVEFPPAPRRNSQA